MNIYDIIEEITAKPELLPTKALKQHWTRRCFSYRDTPRPDYGLLLVLQGEIAFVTRAQSLLAKAGDLVLIPKGCYYEAIFHGKVENYLVNFDREQPLCKLTEPLLLREGVSALCEERFRQLVEERYTLPHRPLRAKGMLLLLLDTLVSSSPVSPRQAQEEALLEQAQTLLTESERSVPEIAKACCISESGLRRLFRARLSCSPAQYRIEQRLARATYLLESTDCSVHEVAYSLNFFDTAYFCKVFRRRFGVTPTQYTHNKRL